MPLGLRAVVTLATLASFAAVVGCEEAPPAETPADVAHDEPAAAVKVDLEPPSSPSCVSLGEVSGSAHPIFGALESGIESATERMREAAAMRHADYVHKRMVATSYGQTVVSGTAYRCGAGGEAPKSGDEPTGAPPSSQPPSGAGGFTFGDSAVDAAGRCRSGGHTWTPSTGGYAQCSSAPVDTGLGGEVAIRFCDERVCALGLIATPPERTSRSWADAYARVRTTLQTKYGPPTARVISVPVECRKDVLPCFDEGRAYLQLTWKWASGQRVVLRMGKLEDAEGDAAIRLRYEEIREGVRPKAGGL